MTGLAKRQEELVRHLVAGGPAPAGFATDRLEAARKALLRKRSDQVRRAWPVLAASYGPLWGKVFAEWAEGRAPLRPELDGYDFALEHPPTGPAKVELMIFEVGRRRPPAFRYGHGVFVIHLAGRVRVFGKLP